MDPKTYGSTPAALYLADHLKTASKKVTRKVAHALSDGQELLKEVITSHEQGFLNVRSLARLLVLISQRNHEVGNVIKVDDELAGNLVINILEGDVKLWRNRAQHARRQTPNITRKLGPGITIPKPQAIPLFAEKDAGILIQRSCRRLARLDKANSLY